VTRIEYGHYVISDDPTLLNSQQIHGLLQTSYWANNRPLDKIEKSITNSHCFGVYEREKGKQVGFARVVTDYATVFYLCDVIVDEAHRGSGVGTALVSAIFNAEQYRPLAGLLMTVDAHGLYEKFGFERETERFMRKPAGA
jgi:ribosomal protein S18 acetylase RimI-like enzyme